MEEKKKVGILGGTFDPPTLAHIQMAAEAINLRYVDEVWLIPRGTMKNDLATEGKHRLEMTKLLIKDFFPEDFPVYVNEIEIKKGELIPTYDLMQELIRDPKNKDIEFYFMIGSALLDSMRTWENGLKLASEINFIIFIRIGYKLSEQSLPKSYIIVHSTFVAASSTDIRNRIFSIRNFQTLDVMQPDMHRKVSSDQNQSFAKMYELDVGQDRLRTIFFDEDEEITEERKKLEEEYLGVYGVVPLSVIEYIKKNELYLLKNLKQKLG